MNQPVTEEEVQTIHTYDGIQEYDNPLPGWWKNLFWCSIFFACFYVVYYHLGVEGRSIHDDYERQMASIFVRRFSTIGILEPDRETLIKYMNDPEWLAVGKAVYKANCVSCHGADGQGLIGPNLTDNYWKNVATIEDVARVIADGAASGSMPAWKKRMTHQNQIVLTAAYIASMRAHPVTGKVAEGKEIPAWVN